MEKEKLLAVLRLQKTQAVGDVFAKKLIGLTGDVRQIFDEKPATIAKINGIGTRKVRQLFDKENEAAAAEELEYILKNKIEYSYFLDADYPYYLKQCIDAPILFFKTGNLDFSNRRIISIVGTRNMTSYGRNFCEALIQNLAPYKPTIVSGFAYGVDICAHAEAIKNNLQTIAVFAHGLDQVYPKAHKKYIHRIIENGGLLTEFWHNEEPLRAHFLQRNRIVAGISQATIVIESAEKGGSLITADIANSYNRDVYAVPGRSTDVFSKGCNNLIKKHQAAMITNADDIAQLLNWDLSATAKKGVQQQLFVNLSETEQKIYDYLLANGKQVLDVIAIDCQIPTYKLASILLQLEMKGVLKPLPGKLFEAI